MFNIILFLLFLNIKQSKTDSPRMTYRYEF